MIMGLDYGRKWNLGFFFLITFKVYLALLVTIKMKSSL